MELVELLRKEVEFQEKETEWAMYGRRDLKLAPGYENFRVDISVWAAKSEQQRKDYLCKFLQTVKKRNLQEIISTDGSLVVVKSPANGKKPHQRKRHRCATTTTQPKKLKLAKLNN